MKKYDHIIQFIKSQKPGFVPKIGLILGSGLGGLADNIQDATIIPYEEIPHFPKSTVSGHKGQMVLGHLAGVPVVCMQGRIHVYEGVDTEAFKIFIRSIKLLGCEMLFLTNASGSLRKDVGPGELMIISDHINIQHHVPLIGANDEEFGPRFFAMDDAYDIKLQQRFHDVAQKLHIRLTGGIYAGVTGPCYETPAEIRAFRILGADCIGMSTVPEVIVARHCGLRVATIVAVTNFAAGMTDNIISHEETLYYGKMTTENLSRLIIATLENLKDHAC